MFTFNSFIETIKAIVSSTIWNMNKVLRIVKTITIYEFKNMNIGKINKVVNRKSKPRF